MDGQSLSEGSGRQLSEMTMREGCNVAYFHIVKDMREEDRAARAAGHKFDESLNDRILHFEEKIGLRPDHDALALWMHKNVLLPARGYTPEQIEEMFADEARAQLPAGVDEKDRWRFEDMEEDGLRDFQGNPWALPGLTTLKSKVIGKDDREAAASEARDTLG